DEEDDADDAASAATAKRKPIINIDSPSDESSDDEDVTYKSEDAATKHSHDVSFAVAKGVGGTTRSDPRRKQSKAVGTNAWLAALTPGEGLVLYNGDNSELKKHKNNILISVPLTDNDLEKKLKPKQASSYVPHKDSTEELVSEARRHPLFKALTSNNLLSKTGCVKLKSTYYWKGGGEKHAEALVNALVKTTINSRKQKKRIKDEMKSTGLTNMALREVKRSQKEKENATKGANLVPLDTKRDLGSILLGTLRIAVKDESMAVRLFGGVYDRFLRQGIVEKFSAKHAELSGDGYMQKVALLSSIGGDDHGCLQMNETKIANVSHCSVNDLLVDILHDVANDEMPVGYDCMTGKKPAMNTNFNARWHQIMLLSRVANVYSLIDQPEKFIELLRLIPFGFVSSDEVKNSHLGQVCHLCNNGVSTIKADMSCCIDPDCMRFGPFELNRLDGVYFNATIAVCNSKKPEYTDDFKRDYVIRTMADYKISVEEQTGREVDILFQNVQKKEEFERFKKDPTPSAAKEVLKRYLPIGIAGYESLTPTEDEEEV
ncbi:hypothetical protein ACHAWC_006696, partial [Mediolabrus comicus]